MGRYHLIDQICFRFITRGWDGRSSCSPSSSTMHDMTETKLPYIPPPTTNLDIEVTTDHEGTFQTNLFCAVNRCRKQVTILSDGPKTTHTITCVEHGVLTSFPDQFAFREYVRFAANKLLELNGEELIKFDAFAITSDVKAPPESMN